MTNDGSTNSPAPAAPTGGAEAGAAAAPPEEIPKLRTGQTARMIGVDQRTVERWLDDGKLRGGRPTDPVTGRPVKGSHRWVEARHAVEITVGNGRAHRVPEELRYLIPQVRTGGPAEAPLPAAEPTQIAP